MNKLMYRFVTTRKKKKKKKKKEIDSFLDTVCPLRASRIKNDCFAFVREKTTVLQSIAVQTNVWKVQNTTGRFLSQLHPSNFCSYSPFPSAKSF